MTSFVISSGQTSGFTLSGGDNLTVLAGGTSSNTSATAVGNIITVSAGGVETLTTVDSGAADFLYGSATSTTVSGGDMFVSAGGVATGTLITGGGLDVVFAGGIDSGTIVEQVGGGGSIIVFGTEVTALIGNGSSTVSSGGVMISASVFDAVLNVAAGGAASGTQLQLGIENVAGIDSGTVLSSPGASLNVLSGGVASNTTASGTLTVSAGGESVSASVLSGGVENVLGAAVATTVSGGDIFISAGGSATGTIITGHGLDVVFAGGVESGTTVQQVGGGSIIVFGTDVDAAIGNGSSTVSSGGVMISATVDDGVLIVAAGGTASNTDVLIGSETVQGTDIDALVSGGSLIVQSGGVAVGTTDDAILTVSAGGRSVSATVGSGGLEFVYGAASNTTVSSGDLFISAGGVATGTLLTGSGLDVVFAGAVEIGTDSEQVFSDGQRIIVYGTDIGTGLGAGSETIMSGGVAVGVSMFESVLTVSSGGTAAATKISLGTEIVFGTDYGAQLVGGGAFLTVSAGGTAFDTIVSGGGQLGIAAGGTGSNATVLTGGVEFVTGIASSTAVDGGDLFVSSGGAALLPTLNSGLIVAFAGGAIFSATLDGGSEIVSGTDLATTVSSGGSLTVEAGGAAQGETVDRGGTMVVSSGGTIGSFVSGVPSGGVLISGGQLDLESGAVISGAFIGFDSAPGGLLKVDGAVAAGTLLQGTVISGFVPGDSIDLTGVAFSAGGTAALGANNVLQVTEDGNTYAINLDPSQSFAGDTFELSADSGGGTLIGAVNNYAITDPLMTNASGSLYYDQVINGQAVYTQIGALGAEWEFDGAGDFSAAGSPGFLIRDTGPNDTGDVFLGQVANGTATFTQVSALGLEWQFEGSADFLGTGQSEFLIRNTGSVEPGALDLGQVVSGPGGLGVSYTPLGGLGLEWQFEGTGDFLNDGNQGFLIRNTGSAEPGVVDVGEIANGAVQYTQVGGVGTEWDFEGTGNFFGNSGPTDFLLWNSGTADPGALAIGQVSNGQLSFTDIGGLGSEWQFVGTGNYIDSDRSDFLIRNTGNGELVVGQVFGAAGAASVQYTVVGAVGSEWNFHTENPALLA